MDKFEPAKRYSDEIDSWESIVATSVVAATGVNLVVSGIVLLIGANYSIILIIIGLLLCILSMRMLIIRGLSYLKKQYTVRGFFMINKTDHKMIQVPEYEISIIMWLYMRAAEAENRDEIIKAWNTERFGEIKYNKENGYHIEMVITEADDVFRELLVYCVLEELSSHLTCYFLDYDKEEIKTLFREDIPELLQNNRFLEWQSAEKYDLQKEREIMFEDLPPEEEFKKLQEIYPKGSFSYSRFEIKMPKDSELQILDNTIMIKHPLFSATFQCNYSSSTPSIPSGFEEYYMGLDKENGNYCAYQYSVTINVDFKLRVLFWRKWRKYFLWIDDIVDRLNEIMSEEAYFEKIGWRTAYIVMRCENNTNEKV